MSKRAFTYNSGVIKSDDAALQDFYIQYIPAISRHDIGPRWVFYWGDIAICFARSVMMGTGGEFQYFDDGRLKLVINVMGIPERYISGIERKVVPAFKYFSSLDEQDKILSLFLEAMEAFTIPIKGVDGVEKVKVRAVIGENLQGQVDSGRFLK